MIGKNVWRGVSIAVPVITAFVLIFGHGTSFDVSTNLYSTGLTIGILLGLLQGVLGYAIYKNYHGN